MIGCGALLFFFFSFVLGLVRDGDPYYKNFDLHAFTGRLCLGYHYLFFDAEEVGCFDLFVMGLSRHVVVEDSSSAELRAHGFIEQCISHDVMMGFHLGSDSCCGDTGEWYLVNTKVFLGIAMRVLGPVQTRCTW